MDDIDQKLIALLRANARTSVVSLARTLDVARGTVQNRLARLEADSLEAFDRALARIRLVKGISNTETSLFLSTQKF